MLPGKDLSIAALVKLAAAPVERLTQRVYNVTAFSLTAGEIRQRVVQAYPKARIAFVLDKPRAAIVDTWPADVDDSAAIQVSQSFPLVEGTSPLIRGSRWQAKSTALANALNNASTT